MAVARPIKVGGRKRRWTKVFQLRSLARHHSPKSSWALAVFLVVVESSLIYGVNL